MINPQELIDATVEAYYTLEPEAYPNCPLSRIEKCLVVAVCKVLNEKLAKKPSKRGKTK